MFSWNDNILTFIKNASTTYIFDSAKNHWNPWKYFYTVCHIERFIVHKIFNWITSEINLLIDWNVTQTYSSKCVMPLMHLHCISKSFEFNEWAVKHDPITLLKFNLLLATIFEMTLLRKTEVTIRNSILIQITY